MEADVCVLSGTSFGGVGADHIRISYANSQANLSKALDRIRAFVEGLAPVAVGAGSSR
jgi:aspartate/methionine/tyrosine aminotransferase